MPAASVIVMFYACCLDGKQTNNIIVCCALHSYRLRIFPYRLPHGNRCFLTVCRKEIKYSFPLPLTGPGRLEGTTDFS